MLFFMEDGLAREGALTRCNRNRDATLNDVECANARRAAAAVAIEAERARAAELERESERKLVALRQRQARESAAAQEAAAAARAAAEAAYEAQWRGGQGRPGGAGQSATVPTFGVPPGPVMPSMLETDLFEVFATGSEPLRPRDVEVAAAEPPKNEVEIPPPELELAEVAVIPRPFRTDDAAVP
jgi:hypothetical protein